MGQGIGLFLGAGASYELGMPLVWELTDEIRNWLTAEKFRQLNEGWRVQGGGYPDVVIEDVISTLLNPDMHYEAVLGYLEVQLRRQRDNKLLQAYHGIYSWLVELVYNILYFRHINNEQFLDKHLPLFDGVAHLSEMNTPLWVFSLNHDLLMEIIAARLSIPLYSGFGPATVTLPLRDRGGNKKGEIQAAVLTQQDIETRALHYPNTTEPHVNLLKIHGALDVFAFNDGHDLLKLLPSGPGGGDVIRMLRTANEDLFYPIQEAPNGRAKVNNEIAYADDDGIMQFLRRSLVAGAFKFDAARSGVMPAKLMGHFQANLNYVKKLVCIGYGFADLHINGVLRSWLEFSSERHIEIVNPGILAVPAFLTHVRPQVTLSNMGASEWLDVQAGITRSPRVLLEKRLGAALRRLGKKGGQEAIRDFSIQTNKEMMEALFAGLDSLPKVDGKPDFSAIANPEATAHEWLSAFKITDDARVAQLVAYVEGYQRQNT